MLTTPVGTWCRWEFFFPSHCFKRPIVVYCLKQKSIIFMKLESNPCIRCGKERIKDKEKSFISGNTKTKIVTFICPDKDCQKIVAAQIHAKEERKLGFAARRIHMSKKKKEEKKEAPKATA